MQYKEDALGEAVGVSHVLKPTLIRLRTWSPFENSNSNLPDKHSTSPAATRANFPARDEIQNNPTMDDEEEDELSRASPFGTEAQQPISAISNSQRVMFAAWNELDQRRFLILAYPRTGFTIWDCTKLDSVREVVTINCLLSKIAESKFSNRFPFGAGGIICATMLPPPMTQKDPYAETRPLLAIVTRQTDARESHVIVYSLRTHQILNALKIAGQAHKIQANSRFIVISCTQPLALHIVSASTLTAVASSPILDLVENPFTGQPVFDLGKGGRFLAYATNRAATDSKYDKQRVKPGSGILAAAGMFDSDAHAFYEDAKRAGKLGGHVAKRVGEGVWQGAKIVGEYGKTYWKPTTADAAHAEPTSQNSTKSAQPKFHAFGSNFISSEAGTVIVIDLVATSAQRSASTESSSYAAVAHFRAYSQPICFLSLSPASDSIFTAPSHANSFDVFELRPTLKLRPGAAAETKPAGKVWHRYRLQRGVRPAETISAKWAKDSRLIAIGTNKGTTHVFALDPCGGAPNLENHFGAKVRNRRELAPLSINLNTIARIRYPHREDSQPIHSDIPNCTHFIGASSEFLTGSNSTAGQNLIIFRPSENLLILSNLHATAIATGANGAIEAASRGQVGRLASTAITSAASGLSQLMKSGGKFHPSPAGKPEFAVNCSAVAEWNVEKQADWLNLETKLVPNDNSSTRRPVESSFGAQAEIETFSRLEQILPKSIYASQQFNFFSLEAQSDLQQHGMRKLKVRSEVRVTQQVESNFNEPIQSAMQTSLEQNFAHQTEPGFPNGLAGKQTRWWKDAIPIKSIAPSVHAGYDSVKRTVSKAATAAAASRTFHGSNLNLNYSSSVSFEEETVFADRPASVSTADTSHCDEAVKSDEVDTEDAAWGFNPIEEFDPDEDSHEILAENEIPFQQDFQDFMTNESPQPTNTYSAYSHPTIPTLTMSTPTAVSAPLANPVREKSETNSLEPSPWSQTQPIGLSTSATSTSSKSSTSNKKARQKAKRNEGVYSTL